MTKKWKCKYCVGTSLESISRSCSLAGINVKNIPDDRIVLCTELLVHPLDVLDGDLLDGGDDVVLGAEVDAFLGLRQSSNQGACDAQLFEHQRGLHHLIIQTGWFFNCFSQIEKQVLANKS